MPPPPPAFEDAEDDRLLPRAPASLALDTLGTEVAFVDFDDAAEGAGRLARLGHALSQQGQESVDGVAVEAGELGDLHGGEIGRDVAEKATKNVL